ncbi:MAG: hypothetical protein ABIQ33_12480 [Caldimonas sp.]
MIKSLSRGAAILLLVLAAVVSVVMAMVWFALPLDGITVLVDGESYVLADLLHGPGAVVLFLIAVAAVVFVVVAAMTMVVVAIGFGAVGLAFGLLMAAASLALVAAPFALIGWLLWRLLRERRGSLATGA